MATPIRSQPQAHQWSLWRHVFHADRFSWLPCDAGLHHVAGHLVRVLAGHFTPENHFGFEGVAWYWHFVDVVWLGLFIFVYWLI